MNLNSLELKEYKNRKELCETLGIKPAKGGRNIKLQNEEFKRYFEWEKTTGHKLRVTKIYSKPKEKVDNRGKSEGSRGNAKAEYIGNIQKLILDLLAQDTNDLSYGRVFLSKNQLLRALKMVNENYAFCKQRIPKLSKFMNIDKTTVEEWYDSTSSMLERNLETALKDLEKQSLILWSREITVAEAQAVAEMENLGEIRKTTKTDKYGEEVEEYTYTTDSTVLLTHREATEKEKAYILRVEREMLKEMDCKNKAEIINKGLWGKFTKKINDKTLKKFNIAFSYKSYKIIFNQDHILEKIEDIKKLELDYWTRKEEQEKLNKGIDDKIHTNAKRRHKKAKDKLEKILLGVEHADEKIKRRANKEYVKHNAELNKNLINMKAADIKELVKKTKTGELTEEELKEIESL